METQQNIPNQQQNIPMQSNQTAKQDTTPQVEITEEDRIFNDEFVTNLFKNASHQGITNKEIEEMNLAGDQEGLSRIALENRFPDSLAQKRLDTNITQYNFTEKEKEKLTGDEVWNIIRNVVPHSKIKNKMHEDIGEWLRFKIEFGEAPAKDNVEYLKKELGENYTVGQDAIGNIVLKRKDEKEFSRVIPDRTLKELIGGTFTGDPKDLPDKIPAERLRTVLSVLPDTLAYTAMSAINEGAALFKPGVAPMARAAIMDGVVSGAYDYGKQKISQAWGIRKEIDENKILGNVILGLTSNPLFGTAATKEKIIEKTIQEAAVKEGMQLQGAKELADYASKHPELRNKIKENIQKQRGLIPMAIGKVADYTSAVPRRMLTAVPGEIYEIYNNSKAMMDKIREETPMGFAGKMAKGIKDKVDHILHQDIGPKITKIKDDYGRNILVNADEARDIFNKEINKLEFQYKTITGLGPVERQELADLKTTRDLIFTRFKKVKKGNKEIEIPIEVKGNVPLSYILGGQQAAKAETAFFDRRFDKKNPVSDKVQQKATDVYFKFKEMAIEALEKYKPGLGTEYSNLLDAYHRGSRYDELFKELFPKDKRGDHFFDFTAYNFFIKQAKEAKEINPIKQTFEDLKHDFPHVNDLMEKLNAYHVIEFSKSPDTAKIAERQISSGAGRLLGIPFGTAIAAIQLGLMRPKTWVKGANKIKEAASKIRNKTLYSNTDIMSLPSRRSVLLTTPWMNMGPKDYLSEEPTQ